MSESMFLVLLLEDEEAHAELIEMAFARSEEPFVLKHAATLAEAGELLEEHDPDIIIADWMLPDGKGLDLLESAPKSKDKPFVIMTSHGSEQVAVDALRSGALDYIVKSPMAFEQMPHSAKRALREWTNIEQRRRAEDQYRILVEEAPVGIVTVSLEGKVLSANPAVARMYGYDSVEEGISAIDTVLDHYSDPKVRERLLREVVERGSVQDFEMEHRRKDGSILWVSYTARAVQDEQGRTFAIEGFVADITTRKLSEERLKDYQSHLESEVQSRTRELEDSRQRFSDIIEFLPDATFVVDITGEVVAWNHAMAELTGIPKEKVLGKGDYEYAIHLYGTRRPVLIDLILEGKAGRVYGPMKNGESTFSVETSLERLHGGRGAYVAIKASPLLDNQGNITGAIESVRDITKRKETELALKEQLSFVQALVDIIPSPVFYLDKDDVLTLCNAAFVESTGKSREEVIGSRAEEVFAPSSLKRQQQAREQLLSGESMVVYEAKNDWSSSPVTDMLVHRAAHRDSDSRVLGIVTVVTDISERKRMENELVRAKETAEAASQAKSRFLATMSHEIRTPMNAIMGLTDITLHSGLEEEQRQNLVSVMDSARHLMSVINDILDFSKIEADKLELEVVDFDLVSVLEPLGVTFAPQADQKNVSLALNLAENIPKALRGDPFRLRQVLINLLGNALKFTEQGVVRLSARLVDRGAGQARIAFSVSDSGIGIATDKQGIIFDSFSQAHSDTSRRYGGTGLGLSISARLVEMMGGQLQVASDEGAGSEFSFMATFGLGREVGDDEALAELDVGIGLSILVAEDNELNAKVAVQFFKRMGHEAQPAFDGWEALEMLEQEHFDLVFMDLEMPNMDGLDAARRIRAGEAGEQNRAIPIVAMTAHALSEVRLSCMEAGMDYFATKPIEYDKLREAVAAVVGGEEADDKGDAEVPAQSEGAEEEFSVLDWQGFLHDLGGNRELLESFYADFKDSLPRSMAKLKGALRAGDTDEVMSAAHALKGSASTARAKRVSELAGRLESLGAEEGLEAMRELLPGLEAEAGLVMAALSSDRTDS